MPATRTTVSVTECTDIKVRAFATDGPYPFVDIVLDTVVVKLESLDDIDRLDVALTRARDYLTPNRPLSVVAH